MNITKNKLSYTIHNHVNEKIAMKIAEILFFSSGDDKLETLQCHPPICRCIHVYFVLNYQNKGFTIGLFVFSKRTPASRSRKFTLHIY